MFALSYCCRSVKIVSYIHLSTMPFIFIITDTTIFHLLSGTRRLVISLDNVSPHRSSNQVALWYARPPIITF